MPKPARRTSSARLARGNRPVFNLDRQLFYWVTQALGQRDRRAAAVLRPHGLRVPEWRTLVALCARERCSVNELAELTAIERSTLSRSIDRMVLAGWVVRLPDADDLRVTRLGLSGTGLRLVTVTTPLVEEVHREAMAGLPASTVKSMIESLRRVRSNLASDLKSGDDA